jgi:thiopeptide-type bacteriocin biosynthesis protein
VTELIRVLDRHPSQQATARLLRETQAELGQIDALGLGGVPAQRYRDLAAKLEALPAAPDLQRLFQVDLAKPSPALVIGKPVVDALADGLRLLMRFSVSSAPEALEGFRQAFASRYEDREVPLLEALDEETGIGFESADTPASSGSPVLRDLPIGAAATAQSSVGFGPRQRLLLDKLNRALADHATQIELTAKEVEDFTPGELDLPDSFCVTAGLVARSAAEVDAGRFQVVLQSAFGPSGAAWFGRFCQADPGLTDRVRTLLAAEEAFRPDAVFAEIAHFPEGRVGNVLSRPVLRDHEIAYLGRSGAAESFQLGADDLSISIRAGRIVLRSKRLGKEVIPRLSNAHNFADRKNLGVYRFLCMLQLQGVRSYMAFNWGSLESARFLPRVVAGKCVLAIARWNLTAAELGSLAAPTLAGRFTAVQKLRQALRLPRFVAEIDSDNFVPIDFDNVLSVENFVHQYAKRPTLRLDEMFPAPDELPITGPEGPFAHELLVPFARNPVTRPTPSAPLPPPRPSAPRTFLPGSEWLFAKLYCGNATADAVLRELVEPLVTQGRQSKALDGWYFIRYGDPQFHIRLRLHGAPKRIYGELLPLLHERAAGLLADGRLWKVQLDTYEREVERYGGDDGLALAEQLFEHDSEAVLKLLPLLEGPASLDLRWRLALAGVDALLGDLGLDLAQKHQRVKAWSESFHVEFKVGKPLETALADRYRAERPQIEAMLGGAPAGDASLAAGLEVFSERSRRLLPWVQSLKNAERERRLTVPIDTLSFSYAHLHANRVLHASARAHELVIYEFLERAYRSKLARKPGPAV